jgi:hypothetical protein
MKAYHEDERRTAVDPASTVVTVRMVDNAVDAETLLPLPVLNRLCSNDVPSRIRQCNVYLSQIVVALDGDSAVGFAAFKTTSGPVRVAHEFWVDQHARAGLAPVIGAMLAALEAAVSEAGCSRLFVVTIHATPLRRILRNSGYAVSLAGAELQGRHISFLLTDLDGGDFELKLTWSDETSRSIHTFRTRAAAMAKAERQLRMWVANGWEPRGDRR